jgi:hypothetical protein
VGAIRSSRSFAAERGIEVGFQEPKDDVARPASTSAAVTA